MINGYIKLQNGVKLFSGKAENSDVFDTTVTIAKECPVFQMDVEDEIIYEGQTTCFNCRYRRWNSEGFTCYKEFPNNFVEEKSK